MLIILSQLNANFLMCVELDKDDRRLVHKAADNTGLLHFR